MPFRVSKHRCKDKVGKHLKTPYSQMNILKENSSLIFPFCGQCIDSQGRSTFRKKQTPDFPKGICDVGVNRLKKGLNTKQYFFFIRKDNTDICHRLHRMFCVNYQRGLLLKKITGFIRSLLGFPSSGAVNMAQKLVSGPLVERLSSTIFPVYV